MNEPQVPVIDAATVKEWMEAREAILVDVREAEEYDFEHVPGAVLLPLSFLDGDDFPPLTDKKVVFMCAVGKRSAAAAKQIQQAGFTNLYNLEGGLNAWRDAGLTTQGARFEAEDYTI